ncbi:hypothetical protein GUJ93_ZPchr0010g9716 [Zizania palustris]|uniref:Uncharacterized protein n=1 Tax=Zizania palustris TaxID=103762 RepID=A0A8J6BQT0_ZIZPA|nr:hypothetical protein GUJ93_ZPchr0010g9716 [Zizania palustris]
MAESLLLAVVRGVVGKAADALVQSVTRMCGVDGDRHRLERQLLAIQCKLMDAEVKRETNPTVKSWMMDLTAIAYEADDVLDDFQYEALRREAQTGDSVTRKVLDYFTPHNPILFRATMSRKLSSVLNKINRLIEEMNTFGLMELPSPYPYPYQQTHSALDDSADIIGRDNDKEVVVKLLMEQQDQHKVQVLPIVGMGGLGKTTLAKMVYNDYRIQNHFELKMWHCVSDKFEVVSLLKSIIELATNERCELPDTIELLRGKLQAVIGQKRFMLVLDDVWNENEKWEDNLKPLLFSVGYYGSVILVTTRSQPVASIMGTLESYQLAFLNDDDSWKLFLRIAFNRGVQEQAELVSIGRLIVDKCGGLPLALRTIGGLMSSKQLVEEWETIARSNIEESVSRGVLSILKLSYTHLPPEMKRCFAFCSVFPKGYEMDKEELIQLWMANGFIQEDRTIDLKQKGEYIFHNLVGRSFLQYVKGMKIDMIIDPMEKIDMVIDPMDKTLPYESASCKMHDLMHDLAIQVECGEFYSNVHYFLRPSIYSPERMMRYYYRRSFLRTFIVQSSSHKLNLKQLKLLSLRALGVAKCNSIYYHYDITNLAVISLAKHLRHLDLSMSSIDMLPNSVCVLYNLQTLRLNGCRLLKHLPEGMRTLRKLIHLYLLGCDSLQRMPPDISLLKNLRTLTTFIVDTKASRGIEELKELNHLVNRLELYNLRKINSKENGNGANLHEKKNLSELLLYWGRNKHYMGENISANEEEVLESLTPHDKLKVLELHGYSGLKIPEWMRDPQMFQRLRVLHISNCPRCKDIPTVQLSVSLERLVLSGMDNLITLCKSVGVEDEGCNSPVQIFPKLKFLMLNNLSKLEKLAENTVTFPNLEILEIAYCRKLESVPDCPVLKKLKTDECSSLAMSSLKQLTALRELRYRGEENISCVNMSLGSWPSLVTLDVTLPNDILTPLEIDENQGPLEKLQTLKLSGHSFFTAIFTSSEMHVRLWKCFTFVQELWIYRCNDLVHWPMKEIMSLIHLRSLYIRSCQNLEGNGSSSHLENLENLYTDGCKSVPEIPKFPGSLEELYISHCPKLVTLPSNLENLSRLKSLFLYYCDDLEELPAGMDGLTSLEKLTIDGCPKMEKFPQGLLQRLATLKSLSIQECPALQRRCREGGEYFELLSSIPHKHTTEPVTKETEPPVKESMSNVKRLVKRFLPSGLRLTLK